MAEQKQPRQMEKEMDASYPILGRVKLGGPLSNEMH